MVSSPRINIFAVVVLLTCLSPHILSSNQNYWIGSGIYDITGPAVEVGMMGYGMIMQRTSGIHMRLRSRAFVIAQIDERQNRIVFVSAELCFITPAVKQSVIHRLQTIYPKDMYNEDNVMISATHTHAGPGGYSRHLLYQITTLGFDQQNFQVIVDGIVQSIIQAHDRLAPGMIKMEKDMIVDSSVNRSKMSYLANPSGERALYDDDVDRLATLLRFVQVLDTGRHRDIGVIVWFGVHGTSLNNQNYLISGDNKGYASYLFEKEMNPNSMCGIGQFVAAFAQTNEGDVSPNLNGPFCPDGELCEILHSTCDGWSQGCLAHGPGEDQFDSCKVIGYQQYSQTRIMFNNAKEQLTGDIHYIHRWEDMENVTITSEYSHTGNVEHTCIGALGDSFGAGTTDGPGDFNFVQGTKTSQSNIYWNWVFSSLLKIPTLQEQQCHDPKPILLFTGAVKWPQRFTQGILPLQVFRIGQLFIIGVPAEFTTMAGRRLRLSIQNRLKAMNQWRDDFHIIISGLSNSYSHYVTTHEEYSVQRYEGASTIFGPFTLDAYQMLFSNLITCMFHPHDSFCNDPLVLKTSEEFNGLDFSLLPGVIEDSVPFGIEFGDVFLQPLPYYSKGDTVISKFWSGNFRNNLRTNGTFLTIEFRSGTHWIPIANDGDWETVLIWERVKLTYSLATIKWNIPHHAESGTYRIRHFGDEKSIFGNIKSFSGTSNSFNVN